MIANGVLEMRFFIGAGPCLADFLKL